MRLEGKVIVFESEEEAKGALADLEFVRKVREEGEKTRKAFAQMSQEDIDVMNREQREHLDRWNRGMCPRCNPQVTTEGQPERKLVQCRHGNEWYEPPPDGITAVACSLCDASDQN